jgi:virulence-associated protein VagC
MEKEAKLYRLGHSWAVTLPIDWVHANGIEADSRVRMNYEDGTVTIRPVAGKGRKRA